MSIYAAFFVLILCVVLLIQSDSQPRKLRNEVADGTLYCFYNDRQYWSRLTDFCVKDSYLYVLFGDRGVLKIYDDSGQYIKSYAFLKTKGASSLYIDNDYVYLYDQQLNYYVFSRGEFVDFVRYSDYGVYLQKMSELSSAEAQRKTDDAIYFIKGASIYRKGSDNISIQVIHRPLYLLFYQGIIPYIIIFFWLVVLFVLKMLSRKVI